MVLINSVLSNMVLYMIFFFQLSKGVLHRLIGLLSIEIVLPRTKREKEISVG